MVATYSKLISTKNQESEKNTRDSRKAGCQSWRPLGRFVTREDWDLVDIRANTWKIICCGIVVVLFWGSSLVSYSFFEVIFLFKAIQAINNVLKNFHVRTCKVSWVINTVETAMGCWKERHFTLYKCKSFGATIRWQCNGSILQTIPEMVEDGYEGSASWCFKLQESCDMPSSVSLVQLFSGKFLADA